LQFEKPPKEEWVSDARKIYVDADNWKNRLKNQDSNTKKLGKLRTNLNKLSVEN
jgi:hypothetical protein